MIDEGPFLGRDDELRRWRGVVDAGRDLGKAADGRSFVVVVHGIGGMGKSRLVRRLLELTTEMDGSRRTGASRACRAVLVDLEDERKRVPDRYPPLEGPSVGTLLYTLERTICEDLGAPAEEAFADFRGVLGQIIDVVRDTDRIRQEAQQAGGELSAEDRKGLENAAALVGGLLGAAVAGPIVGAGLAVGGTATKVFRGRRVARRERARGESPSVPQRRIDLALDAERLLVRAFAKGVAQAAGTGTLIVAIDTGEIAAAALAAIRNAAADGTSNVVWLIAGRFDTPAAAGYLTSTVGEFERAISSDRLTVIAISVFDRGLQREYLESRHPDRPFTDDEFARIDRATRGIPLGLSLVAEMLRDGMSLEILDEAIDNQGEANLLIQVLAERFLYHALRQPPGTSNALRNDLTGIFALIADETAEGGKILGYPVQRRIRAALLGIDPDRLRDRLDELAARHDFVLASTGQVHEEVATVVRDYMLGNDQRHDCTAMHERALTVIGQELKDRFETTCVGDRANDEAWRLLAAAYVRHEFWISNQRGITAVCCILPAAVVLRPELASVLHAISARFRVTATNEEQVVLRGLPWFRRSFLDRWLEQRRESTARMLPGPPVVDDADRVRANRVLSGQRGEIPGLSSDDASRAVLSELMAADDAESAGQIDQQLQCIVRAHERLEHQDPALAAAVGSRAQSAASRLVLGPGNQPHNNPDGLMAAKIAAARQADNAWAHCCYALALEGARRSEEADAAYQQALDVGPRHTAVLCNYADFLTNRRGEHDRAQELYERALDADPKHTYSLRGYARLLTYVRAEHDRAQALYERALDADPKNADSLGNYAYFLTNVRGEHDRAQALYERALDANPKSAHKLGHYALFLTDVRGEHDRAQELYERALDIAPKRANVLGNYARLRLERGDDVAATDLIGSAFEHAADRDDPLRAELWMYLFALGPQDERDHARSQLARLLAAGARSPRWDFSRIVTRAINQGHPDGEWLERLADVISDRANDGLLEGWTAWPSD